MRESERSRRVEFYNHNEGWKNKLICGDSLHVMESLLHYEGLRGKVKVELIMIRPDTLAEGFKATQPEMLFSPLALPDIEVEAQENGKNKKKTELRVLLKGVALFDPKRRTTEYQDADSGYVSAWYLDEDYDGDCFVDCQMFFDCKKRPAVSKLGIPVPEGAFGLRLASEFFTPGRCERIAVKVVDVYGNESTVVKELTR